MNGLLRVGVFPPMTLLLLLAALGGCRGDAAGDGVPVDVDVALAPTPPVVGPARAVLSVFDSVGAPLDGARVMVEATMDHPGMVPVLETAEGHGEGRYVIPALEFDMAGDWILIVRIELPDGREAVRERQVRVASGPAPGTDP